MNQAIAKKQIKIQQVDFQPPFWAKNCHVQSLLGTVKFRRPLLIKKAKTMLAASREILLEAGTDETGAEVKLQSFFSPQPDPKTTTVILIHGWEGSHESLYLLSSANSLYQAGYQVLRLNLRDHGSSHHLNRALFHSNRLHEVVNAVRFAQQNLEFDNTHLIGFSLGGNFATRIAEQANSNHIRLNKTLAICPAINPMDILHQLENGLSFYHDYFIKKWKRSLRKKQQHFPDSYNFEQIYPMKSMRQMTEHLLQLFGDYQSAEEYFNGYALSGEKLQNLDSDVTILMSKDDPVINYQDTFSLTQNEYLQIYSSQYGGHCGFIKNAKLESWADDFILQQLA
ncbi:YheT family hydrolase [Kangiella sp. TOML190]|uniref:YheT family hydrolase n=1 Tax=Kangiella sp. TOML190 TaxID=2931351 RepID=UPI00203F1B6E|nr:alpha/beta fold hydrolase [Kangiella sp. TOML190]